MKSNRFHLVDRERIRGSVYGVDFGNNVSCIARSPAVALIWDGGSVYWSGIGIRAYGESGLHIIKRGQDTSRQNNLNLQPKGGRLSVQRVQAAVEKISEAFGDDVVPEIIEAVRWKKTLLIEGGGDAFDIKPPVRKRVKLLRQSTLLMRDRMSDSDDKYKVFAPEREEIYGTRQEALRVFQQCVTTGKWCEVWTLLGNNSGVKIADFPGVS